MRKCIGCNTEEAIHAWQPFGPDETGTFTALGSHYRGFPVIALGDACKTKLEQGQSVAFRYRGTRYSATMQEVVPCP